MKIIVAWKEDFNEERLQRFNEERLQRFVINFILIDIIKFLSKNYNIIYNIYKLIV